MSWYSSIFAKNPDYKGLSKRKDKLPPNIYNKGMTFKEHNKKFHRIHFIFKYKFLVPLLRLGKKLLGKHLITKIPNKNHNRNLIIFNKAYDIAMKKWVLYYLRNTGDEKTRQSRKKCLKTVKTLRADSLGIMRDMIVTMYLYDTAYREFTNILLHEIAIGMTKEYTQEKYKQQDLTYHTGHLFFTTDVYDVNYYVLEKQVQYTVKVHVESGEELLQRYEMMRNIQ